MSAEGLAFLKEREGFGPKVYQDTNNVDTIGYGHVVKPGEDWSKGITEEKATELLKEDVKTFVSAVNASLNVQLKQNQFDALVCFAFNAGPTSVNVDKQMMTAVNSGKGVTLDNFKAYANVNDPRTGKLAPDRGLINRAQKTFDLYSKGIY